MERLKMIGQKMQEAVNDQINAELYSSYLYLSMSAAFESMGMPGCANWMKIQAMEEMTHADKFYAYLINRGGRVALKEIAAPPREWSSAKEIFEAVLEHEIKVTALINRLVDVAEAQKDHAAKFFLQWFVEEQVEEESNATAIIDQIRLASNNPGAMLMVDKELGQRVFTPPTQEQG